METSSKDFYTEAEQKPDVRLLRDRLLRCTTCLTSLDISSYPPLLFGECQKCGRPNFIPYLVKDYWLYRPLGGGGMGSVYKALHAETGADYAMKILPRLKKEDQRLISALMLEAETGATFGDHPHITKVADYGKYQDEYFMVTEFVSGKRLDELIDSQIPISQKYMLLWGMQILSAEQHVYNCGYLYRDLKPQNIIIDGYGNVHLIDFGLCMSLDSAANDVSDMIEGSPQYMPPERLVGEPEGMFSEIYSLGMVIFHSLSRKPYYTATTAIDLARKHVSSLRIASVSSRLPINIDPEITEVIDRMIRRNSKERYQSYKETLVALSRIYNRMSN